MSLAFGFDLRARACFHNRTMSMDPTSYDLVLYPSYAHSQTHPDRLAVIGRLFGMDPGEITGARVLELGCGTGSNLVPMAAQLPASTFVGIDLATRPIEVGNQMIRDLGLRNVRLVQGDLREVEASWGRFDYILAHGLYSWVPAEVQAHLLHICRSCLSPQGIAFVSYNAFPGGHLTRMVREMMRFHVRGFPTAGERVTQAKALAHFLAEAQESQRDYRLWMKTEWERIQDYTPGVLYHDDLAEVNEPLYFTEFMERASRHGLQYLGEAHFADMSELPYNPSVRETLTRLGTNRILREQYLDFIKCRRFRQTLLCQGEVSLTATASRSAVGRLLVSSAAECRTGGPDLSPGVCCVFEAPKDARVETDFALGKAALLELGPRWPCSLSFDELQQRAEARLAGEQVNWAPDEDSRETLQGFLLNLYAAGVVHFRTYCPPAAAVAGDRPVATPVARWQIQHSHFVTTNLHQAIEVEDEIGRHLLSRLDGTRDRAALVEELREFIQSKGAIEKLGSSDVEIRRAIGQQLEKNLHALARLGLLVE